MFFVCSVLICSNPHIFCWNGPLARYVKLRLAHVPGMPGTFSLPPWVSDPDIHHGTCVTHMPWCMPGSLTSGFLWNRWQGKHFRCMRNPQFCASSKRPMTRTEITTTKEIFVQWNMLQRHWFHGQFIEQVQFSHSWIFTIENCFCIDVISDNNKILFATWHYSSYETFFIGPD